MQKIINVLAIASFTISSSIAAGGVYVYVNRDSIIDGVKQKVMGSIGGAALGGALTGDVGLPSGENAAVGGPTGAGIELPSL
tara:strand:- start:316 stop:561 length:246 start_codon:yes stop_codon:yes gene_type:complete